MGLRSSHTTKISRTAQKSKTGQTRQRGENNCGLEEIRRNISGADGRNQLFHQQHLPGAFDGLGQTALIMGGHPGIFAGQDTALVGNVLAEQIRVFKIQSVFREINLWLWPRRPAFHGPLAAFFFVGMGFAWHKCYLISR